MPNQTVTRSIECEREPAEIYEVLSKAQNIPRWAPVFADAIERIDEHRYLVTKGDGRFELEIILNKDAGTVDYLRGMKDGKRGGAYIRVTSRPVNGSTIIMTVPIGPNTSEADGATVLEKELASLGQLV